ncbi:MAG: 2,3,4,5-tetrahydropyridine-2,6-dicarboxylate N-succinyltransferase [Candidatus Cloacimonetes bacterium]|jgi:2,3,4,5-tetrahydropyridine-2-carboxylate N-succinyltransferase|nr:2,3,4,5-tetrahydropyridine-2,6-dicarboxylate N-succinyltransferase [Candidatus Cloacimonadota bacterium]
MSLKSQILELYNKTEFSDIDRKLFLKFRNGLNTGEIRAAEKIEGKWITNNWVKKGILAGFQMGNIVQLGTFIDKDTYPIQDITNRKNVRMVPGGSSIREGAYIGENVIMMPPMYINVGAYIDDGSMIDSHALVGTCAQVGKNVHLSAASQIGGVLEPIGANPVIVEDNVFIGGNCGIYDGVIIEQNAIIAAGVIITGSTPVFDSVNNHFLTKDNNDSLHIPQGAVVVPGTRKMKSNNDFSIYCPIIIKYRDEKSNIAVTLEDALR